jgi:hydroxyacylglutathione hydrolase
MLVRIKGAISNCYLLKGEKAVLVDSGAPGDLKGILAGLKQHGVAPENLALILLTHGHSAHAGCAAELRRRGAAQIAMHVGDAPLARQGRNGALAPQSPFARLLRPFIDEPFDPFEPDLVFRESISLEPYGIRGRVLPTPGHTSGSISVVLANGEALIGDVLCGSLVWPNKSREHFYCNDPETNLRSIVRLAREGLLRCHPGHFGSFPGTELGQFIDTDSGEVLEFSGRPV